MPTSDDSNVVINMRVTANSIQGHRKYMEDCYKIRFQRESSLMNSQNKALLNAANEAGYFKNQSMNNLADKSDADPQSDILFSYFGIFDGHGGKEASQFAKEKLYWKIVEQKDFWSEDHSKVLNAIREGFIQCHLDMWNELSSWPKTASGLPSTSGSTATVLFIRKSKAYVGHVGDSGLLIGYSKADSISKNTPWLSRKLTRDHKPEDPIELKRIESMGGSVVTKSGVNRVVWNRPIMNPSKRTNQSHSNNLISSNTVPYDLNHYKYKSAQVQTERIPFLAVARSLGDLWSYDSKRDEFIVSPVPDVFHFDLDPSIHKCLILATDGLWNVMRTNECVDLVRQTDQETELMSHNKTELIEATSGAAVQPFVNPSQRLVNTAMQRCCEKMIRADNTTCITIMLDQPPSYDDYLSNSNETIIKATNLTNLDINKTFDKTRVLNISNDYDEEEADEDEEELADDDLDEYAIARMRRERKLKSANKTFNQTTSTEIAADFNTPLNANKRSRSLTSVRRRHWSASSNRSTSVTSTSQQKVNSKHKFVNMESRADQHAFVNKNRNDMSMKINNLMNKSSSSNAVYQTSRRQNLFYNKSNSNINGHEMVTRSVRHTLKANRPQTTFETRKSMNTSSVSIGINKLSKNIRKSFNDLYSFTKSEHMKSVSRRGEAKENHAVDKETDEVEKPPSKYSLRSFKNRLIQTKNILLNKKRKIFAQHEPTKEPKASNNNNSKHQSMPNLNKIGLDDLNDDEFEKKHEDESDEELAEHTYENNLKVFNCEYAESKTLSKSESNQSFVNNVKSKLNSLKRKNKAKNADMNFEAEMVEEEVVVMSRQQREQTKRIKFF